MMMAACKKNKPSKEWETKVNSMVSEWYQKELNFPDESFQINLKTQERNRDSSTVKLIVYIDGTCSVCISELSFWGDFIQELKEKELNCGFQIFIYTEDVETLQKYLSALNFNFPVYVDLKPQFPKLNHIYDKRFQTFLIDENHKVMLIGSPTMNPRLRKTYIETIKKQTGKT